MGFECRLVLQLISLLFVCFVVTVVVVVPVVVTFDSTVPRPFPTCGMPISFVE